MTKELRRQIELLKEHGVDDSHYVIENGRIKTIKYIEIDKEEIHKDLLKGALIERTIYLKVEKSVHKDFLKRSVVEGGLRIWFRGSKDCSIKGGIIPEGFLQETVVNYLSFANVSIIEKNFLKNKTVHGSVVLTSHRTSNMEICENFAENANIKNLDVLGINKVHKNFLKNSFVESCFISTNNSLEINEGFAEGLALRYLDILSRDSEVINNIQKNVKLLNSFRFNFYNIESVKKAKDGYDKEGGYCFFDRILSKVLSVSKKKDYTIYTTPFDFIAQKGDYTAHAPTIKKAIQDVEFKIIAEKIKKDPILPDTEMTVKKYRIITGACDYGCREWMGKHNILYKVEDEETVELQPMKAKDLMPLLEKSNAYGIEKIKELICF